ncbi:Hsp20/alpha crystallin family protein [bacterium]|nr:Hsp20/alpha crystallin family protein [bacterium]
MASLVPYTRIPTSVFPFTNSWFDTLNDLMTTASDDTAPASLQMDVEETPDAYTVTLTVPGVARDQIDVEMNQGRLNITVDKKDSDEVAKKTYLRRETSEFHATRGIYLKDAAREGLTASLKDGILTVNVPKKKADDNVQKITIA